MTTSLSFFGLVETLFVVKVKAKGEKASRYTHTGRESRDHKQKCKGRKFTQSQFLSLNLEERQRENVCKYESMKRKKKNVLPIRGVRKLKCWER